MSYTPAEHPLAQTLRRVRQLSPYLKPELGAPAGEGWVAAADLFAPASPLLEALIAATQARLRTKTPAIVASAILQSYQWPVISSAIACYLVDRRVPDLALPNVLLQGSAEHEFGGLALRHGSFAALPADPAATHPDVAVVRDQKALCAALHDALTAHLGAVIAQLCARLGCKPRGLWLNVTDGCAGMLIWLMPQQDKTATFAQIEARVDALIRLPGSPLNSCQLGVIELAHQERRGVFLDRATCCFWYKCEGGDYCASCPKRSPDERKQRLLAHLAEEHSAATAVLEEATA